MGSPPTGFAYTTRKSGDVVISRDGAEVTVLRGTAASRFLESVATGDPQELMARVTGNYRRGNERMGRRSPKS
jgi:hypothetical protein